MPSYHVFSHSLWAAWRKCGLTECGGRSKVKAAGIISPLCSLEQEIGEGYSSWPPHTPFTSLWIWILREKKVESPHCNYCHIGRSQKLSRWNNLRCIQRHFTLLKYPLCSWFPPSWKSLCYRQNINVFIKDQPLLHYRYQYHSFILLKIILTVTFQQWCYFDLSLI